MAKTLVFEGCPACARKHSFDGFGASLPMAIDKEFVIDMLKSGAIGAGAATAIDFVMPKIPYVQNLGPTVKPVVNLAIMVLGGMYVHKTHPEYGIGIAIGGGSVALYKLIAALLGKVAVAPAATAGLGYLRQVPAQPAYNGGMGTIIAREAHRAYAGYGDEEILVD